MPLFPLLILTSALLSGCGVPRNTEVAASPAAVTTPTLLSTVVTTAFGSYQGQNTSGSVDVQIAGSGGANVNQPVVDDLVTRTVAVDGTSFQVTVGGETFDVALADGTHSAYAVYADAVAGLRSVLIHGTEVTTMPSGTASYNGNLNLYPEAVSAGAVLPGTFTLSADFDDQSLSFVGTSDTSGDYRIEAAGTISGSDFTGTGDWTAFGEVTNGGIQIDGFFSGANAEDVAGTVLGNRGGSVHYVGVFGSDL
ncbi:MAG: transferrin-binding protein-like solute binding protein [Litorivicinus sp.]